MLTRAHVKRVLFDENRAAVGVSFVRDGRDYEVRANNEVILSAGTVGTPHILMLSGVGDKRHLNELGVSGPGQAGVL